MVGRKDGGREGRKEGGKEGRKEGSCNDKRRRHLKNVSN
jgi:hypothetical protein